MEKEKDPVQILLDEAFPATRKALGPCKLTWYVTNKQREFEFMADAVTLHYDKVQTQLAFDPQLLKQVLMREEIKDETQISYLATTMQLLECKFQNPDYGARIATRFIKRLVKAWGPQQLLLVPNYGDASTAQSFMFWRAIPCIVTMRQITFHVLPNDMGERVRQGL